MINIAYNDKITDSSLISLSKCLSLKALEIRGCCCISSVGLSAIAVGCKQLTVLDIKNCVNVNDDGMIPLAQFSHNLKQARSYILYRPENEFGISCTAKDGPHLVAD